MFSTQLTQATQQPKRSDRSGGVHSCVASEIGNSALVMHGSEDL